MVKTEKLTPTHGLLAFLGAGRSGEVALRMTGKYSDGGLLLDFSGNTLVLDCGQAEPFCASPRYYVAVTRLTTV